MWLEICSILQSYKNTKVIKVLLAMLTWIDQVKKNL